ncbi:DUF397 domain-containing protein [Streptomyces hiroshimensis]|uniref:DUF397 domain-containing protein n=1 Tax=Streptomyces hiroshimensis TaxID=66424 RepID=A0ABQ2ZEA7_9ACTN|nr:DUF397 domain-containing protein [Streptomyces hiroshimensis]GGY09905.1 hypothetical protein GCM10010324_65930 [Streptomyces hiroshimensis]
MNDGLAWFKSSYSDDDGSNCVEVALPWQKSSYSDGDGSECVEVALPWRKSSRSDDEGDNCVEIASSSCGVHIRDSKEKAGPQLAVGAPAWAGFVAYIAAA